MPLQRKKEKYDIGVGIYHTKINPYVKEIKKLADGLISKGIGFTFKCLYDGFQIVVDDWDWDVVCHGGSYGHDKGLLEVMGSISKNENDVEGWLTAEDILARL